MRVRSSELYALTYDRYLLLVTKPGEVVMTGCLEPDAGNGAWCRVGPYEFVHPSGWTITNRTMRRRLVWTLQNGYRSEGGFCHRPMR